MIDFLFSSRVADRESLRSALSRYRGDTGTTPRSWSGPWGSLCVIGRAYPGFSPIETDRHILVVLGGPLPRADFSVPDGTATDDGSKWILRRWLDEEIAWDEDLVGHFAVARLDKEQSAIRLVTDINSYVPLYNGLAIGDRRNVVGSHADALAHAAGWSQEIDSVSVADFLIHKTVCHPYTMYERIRQVPPSSEMVLTHGLEPRTRPYWTLGDTDTCLQLDATAAHLRGLLQSNVARICAGQEAVGLLMSGGEDSRVVATVASPLTVVHGVTFAESDNREVQVSRTVAQALGMRWKYVERRPTHYVDHAKVTIRLAESHHLFVHGHAAGLTDALPANTRCLGALFADNLFKGTWIAKTERIGLTLRIRPDRIEWGAQYEPIALDRSLLAEVAERRRFRQEELRACRPEAWAETVQQRPASASAGFPHLSVLRRSCFSYEPFIDAGMFKLAASTPQAWKVNRRLFHTAMKPLLRATKRIPHSNGMYPYYGVLVNAPFRLPDALGRRTGSLFKRIGLLGQQQSRGSWPDWNRLCASAEFSSLHEAARERVRSHGDASHQVPKWLWEPTESENRWTKAARLQITLWLVQD